MSTATSLVAGASAAYIAKNDRLRSAPMRTEIASLHRDGAEEVRPSRIGGAPLTGARAVSAYQRTSAIDAIAVLSRIDEHV